MTKSRPSKVIGALTALALLTVVVGSEARGSAASHWKSAWAESFYGDVNYYVDSGAPSPFNTSTARSELGLGRQTWNNVSGAPVLVDYGGTTSMSGVVCGSAGSLAVTNGHAWVKACNISALAVSHVVLFNGLVEKALIVFDTSLSSGSWHISSSTSVASGKYDLRGVAGHELGHVLGAMDPATLTQLHINLDCNSITVAQTMCPFYLTATAQYRTAQTHESNDFKDAY